MTQRIQSTLENVASERAVLAGLMQHGQECLVEVEAFVKEDTFTLEQNSIVFRCLTHALRENERVEFTDVLSSARALNLDTYLEKDESVKHLRAIANTPIDIGNVEGHAKRLARLSFARRLQSETREIYLSMNKITGDEPLASILACAEEPIQQICMDFMKEDELSPKSIGEDIDEYLEHLRENQGKSIGIPTGMASFDAAIGGGLRRGGVNLISARPKALRHGSKVYTQNGFVNIEDVEVGDWVKHPFKGNSKVAAVWPHKEKDIYRVSFRDGDYVECCEDHLWHVTKSYGNKSQYVKTVKELEDDLRIGGRWGYKWNVPLPKPVEFEGQHVELDPYFIGILLGDGSVSNNTCVYHTMDQEIHDFMTSYAHKLGCEVKVDSDSEDSKATSYRINSIQDKLRKSGIWGKNCYDKRIPKEYIYNSVDVRMGVLAGLLDTDGDCTVDPRSGQSRTRFGSVSFGLCQDVKEIVQSLGGLCSINETVTKCDGKEFKSFRCEVRLPQGVNPFRLSRKRNNFTERVIGDLKRTIVSIEKVGIDNATCITLEDDDGLFMTDNYVVTHNTGKSVVADNVALHIADNLNIPVLVLDTEMSKQDHWDRMLANISNIPINDIGSGAIYEDPAKVDAVKLAANKLKSIPYDYISISGRPFEEILSIAKRWLLKEVGYDENGKMRDCVIIYDYLKLMSSSSISNNMAEFQVLGFQITQLHDFCVKYDCACLSFVQLNRDGITKESTDAVSGSDRLIWLCTSFTIFKDKTEEEILTDGKQHGNKKLVPIVQRHGPGIEDQGYICLNMEGKFARVSDLGTIRERQKAEEFENADSQEEDVDQNF